MSRNLTIKQAQGKVETFLQQRGKDWTQIDNHFYVFTHLSEEVGELARHVINAEFSPWIKRQTSKGTKSNGTKKALSQIEDDLGDILYHLFKLAIVYNIDLAEAFKKTMTNIKNKYGRN